MICIFRNQTVRIWSIHVAKHICKILDNNNKNNKIKNKPKMFDWNLLILLDLTNPLQIFSVIPVFDELCGKP